MPWTYTSNSCGYMLYKDGVSQGGVGTLGTKTHTSDGRRRHHTAIRADVKMYAESAQRQCDQRNREELRQAEPA
jgi:hypothetical protein